MRVVAVTITGWRFKWDFIIDTENGSRSDEQVEAPELLFLSTVNDGQRKSSRDLFAGSVSEVTATAD